MRRTSGALLGASTLLVLGCMGVGPTTGPIGESGFGDVAYKRYKNLDEIEILDFVSAEKVTIFYSGRFDDRPPRVGTWSQDGAEIVLELEPLAGETKPHSKRVRLRQLGRCSLALYDREKSDGSSWASGALQDDGKNLIQPVLFEQKWPPCERY